MVLFGKFDKKGSSNLRIRRVDKGGVAIDSFKMSEVSDLVQNHGKEKH